MASFLDKLPALVVISLATGLTAGLACGPKMGNDEGGDSSGTMTTTGEELTTGASDPTSPGTASATNSGSGGSAGSATGTTTTATSDPGTASATTGATSATTVATSQTSLDTGDTSDPPPVVPCEGMATPLAGVETLAYLKSQIPPQPNPTGTSGSSGGGEPDPATLYVRLSDQKASCVDPQASLPCGEHWDVTIAIPPEFQSPGVFNLLGQDVTGSASETGPVNGNNSDCAFGGGSFGATFEILAIDDQNVTGRLCHVDGFFSFSEPQLEGSFVAPRCP
ncbi:hypothetical protein [Nannocystis sp.]|uniref:hypothetical protein n=1 Tax=Nannocystis sp. TaxID=1962667 RepID=UPI0024276C39|nr:hypothetical protein [Nannocystis sp.]MBK7827785.1 hypothetical protein [Nannocystis sp.]MBK9753825.1 hypothetical protein [Nannocystis sp.]